MNDVLLISRLSVLEYNSMFGSSILFILTKFQEGSKTELRGGCFQNTNLCINLSSPTDSIPQFVINTAVVPCSVGIKHFLGNSR